MNNNSILAKNLIGYSCNLKAGEKVLIEAGYGSEDLVKELIKETYKAKAYPFVRLMTSSIQKEIMKNMDEECAKYNAKYMLPIMQDMDAYISIRASNNIFEASDLPQKSKDCYEKYYSKPVHLDCRVNNTKWVILNYPTPAFAQLSNMSTEEFTDFYYKVCNLNYSKMDKAMDNLKQLMEQTDRVKIIAPNTNLEFSIKNIPAIKCAGQMNIPDGEVFTAPVKESINGKITYNTASMYRGIKFENVSLTFKNGKIVSYSSSVNNDKLASIFETDEGAKYVGEFAFGLNPHIKHPMLDILFDEKINGSIHFTPGACYNEAPNGNKSAIHWDLVLIQRKDYGGGEIYFDDKLIRKNGIFVLQELECLNPKNLI